MFPSFMSFIYNKLTCLLYFYKNFTSQCISTTIFTGNFAQRISTGSVGYTTRHSQIEDRCKVSVRESKYYKRYRTLVYSNVSIEFFPRLMRFYEGLVAMINKCLLLLLRFLLLHKKGSCILIEYPNIPLNQYRR